MTTPSALNEYSQAEEPARVLLERLGWTYAPREALAAELHIEGPNTLDKLFDAMFGEEPESVREEIRRRYANRETVAGALERIQMIALDIAQHFKDKVRPNGFKAQGVASSRARPALHRAAEELRHQRLLHHHHRPQRRPGVPGCKRSGPGTDRQRLRLPRGRAGGAGGSGHAAHRVRRAGGAGALP